MHVNWLSGLINKYTCVISSIKLICPGTGHNSVHVVKGPGTEDKHAVLRLTRAGRRAPAVPTPLPGCRGCFRDNKHQEPKRPPVPCCQMRAKVHKRSTGKRPRIPLVPKTTGKQQREHIQHHTLCGPVMLFRDTARLLLIF